MMTCFNSIPVAIGDATLIGGFAMAFLKESGHPLLALDFGFGLR